MSNSSHLMIVGLTGGIGSGKSAAAKIFQQLGVTVVDADIASRKVVEPGSYGLKQIAEHFGEQVLIETESGSSDPNISMLNRRALREIIFSNPDERQWLNNLLHPLIKDWMDSEIAKARTLNSSVFPYAIKVIPLLVETKNQQQVDQILVIECEPEIQINRVQNRDHINTVDVSKIINTQATNEERNKVCDDKIINNGSLEELVLEVKKMHNKYLKLATNFNA